MDERDYWRSLEFRVSCEFSQMSEKNLRFRWCDGFEPEHYLLKDRTPRITGEAWIFNGQQPEKWRFTLFLNQKYEAASEIDWASLLPPNDVTRWIAVDLEVRELQIEPGAAVADGNSEVP